MQKILQKIEKPKEAPLRTKKIEKVAKKYPPKQGLETEPK